MDYLEKNKKEICDFIDSHPNLSFFYQDSGYAVINNDNPRDILLKMAYIEPEIVEFLRTQSPEDIEKLKKISKLHSLKKQVEELEKELSI